MSRYLILIADPLLSVPGGLQWPPGVQLAGGAEPGPAGYHWHLLDDPEGPESLEGRQVVLKMRRADDGTPEIAERRLVLTHLCPPDDSGLLACCELPIWETPSADRITEDKALVTCGGAG